MMRLAVFPEFLLIAPLVMALFALVPWLTPTRAAIAHGPPDLHLWPGEVVVGRMRPDKGILAGFGFLGAIGFLGVIQILRWVGGVPVSSLALPLLPVVFAALAFLILEGRRDWVLTSHRLLADPGVVMLLGDVRCIRVAPGVITVHGRSHRPLRLIGVPGASASARVIHAAAALHRQ